MLIPFTKMHGLGNDFVLLDERDSSYGLNSMQLARIADRRFGIGCDQVLLLEPASVPGSSGKYRIFNADGSSAEHCGNGVRCVARYLRDVGAMDGDSLSLEINGALHELIFEMPDRIRVDMGRPVFSPREIPVDAQQRQARYAIVVGEATVEFGCVSLGNPHAVTLVDDVESADVVKIGSALQIHDFFPAKVNVGFMQIVSPSKVKLRVFERGVGETLACGTGACAAVAIGQTWRQLDQSVEVELAGGILHIDWSGIATDPLWMTGPATTVFAGTIEL